MLLADHGVGSGAYVGLPGEGDVQAVPIFIAVVIEPRRMGEREYVRNGNIGEE